MTFPGELSSFHNYSSFVSSVPPCIPTCSHSISVDLSTRTATLFLTFYTAPKIKSKVLRYHSNTNKHTDIVSRFLERHSQLCLLKMHMLVWLTLESAYEFFEKMQGFQWTAYSLNIYWTFKVGLSFLFFLFSTFDHEKRDRKGWIQV